MPSTSSGHQRPSCCSEVYSQSTAMVRTALNGVSDEWQVLVQSILGRERLPSWEEMWAALRKEELRRDLVKVNLNGSSGSGMKTKEEEENAALASKGNGPLCIPVSFEAKG